jgi:hypothetical protein
MVKRQTLEQIEAGLFLLWMVLLAPWLLVATTSLMVFDGGPSLVTYIFVASIWIYPVSVGIVWWFRDREPLIAFVPLLNIAVMFIVGWAG